MRMAFSAEGERDDIVSRCGGVLERRDDIAVCPIARGVEHLVCDERGVRSDSLCAAVRGRDARDVRAVAVVVHRVGIAVHIIIARQDLAQLREVLRHVASPEVRVRIINAGVEHRDGDVLAGDIEPRGVQNSPHEGRVDQRDALGKQGVHRALAAHVMARRLEPRGIRGGHLHRDPVAEDVAHRRPLSESGELAALKALREFFGRAVCDADKIPCRLLARRLGGEREGHERKKQEQNRPATHGCPQRAEVFKVVAKAQVRRMNGSAVLLRIPGIPVRPSEDCAAFRPRDSLFPGPVRAPDTARRRCPPRFSSGRRCRASPRAWCRWCGPTPPRTEWR